MALRTHRFGSSCQPIDIELEQMDYARFQKRLTTTPSLSALQTIFEALEKATDTITDENIIDAYITYSKQITTDAFARGELEFTIAAQICSYRPHLRLRLLERPIRAVQAAYGTHIKASEVQFFIENQLLRPYARPQSGLPDAGGVEWLNRWSKGEDISDIMDRLDG